MPGKTFLMITTGGTIAGNVAGEAQSAKAVQTELEKILKGTLNEIQGLWGVRVGIETEEIDNVDSSDILPHHWTKIAEKVHQRYDEFDGFIVTHGTNTMGYTCAALAFALPNLNKPVVVTGSQVPYGRPASDALMNLDNALRTAAYPYGGGVRGVVCVFGSYIITGTRAKKSTEFDLDAFRSFSTAEIGRIGRIMQINEDNLRRHHDYLSQSKAPALMARDLVLEPQFDVRFLSLTEFPGMDPDIFRRLLESLIDAGDLKGLIFRAFGAGDVSHHLHGCFEYLKERQVPVVVTTQAPNGNSNFKVNDPGQALEENGLAIPAFDMSIEAITTKLAWLLAKEVNYSQMLGQMHEDLHGEISTSVELA
jgi:L-asparaginase